MKTRYITILAAIALALAAFAFAGCDRTIDDVNPDPISPGFTGPGTAYQNIMQIMGKPPIIEIPEDTTSGGGEDDAVIEDDLPDVGETFEINECIGGAVYCECLEEKGSNEEDYGSYCECMESSTVPGGDNADFCGCCFFAFSESYPEYQEVWQHLADECTAKTYTQPTCLNSY